MITFTAKITLADGTEIPINKKNALSIDQRIIDRGDIILPSWGIISNSGTLKFVDYNGDIQRYASNQQLIEGLPVEIYLNNTIVGAKITFVNFATQSWDYDSNNKEVVVKLTDKLEQWQNTVVDVLPYRATTSSATGKEIYEYWHSKTPAKFAMKTFEQLDEATKTVLNKFKVPIFVSESTTLWSAWALFCGAVQAHIFRNNKGETIFICRD